jgi:hypothetical protein
MQSLKCYCLALYKESWPHLYTTNSLGQNRGQPSKRYGHYLEHLAVMGPSGTTHGPGNVPLKPPFSNQPLIIFLLLCSKTFDGSPVSTGLCLDHFLWSSSIHLINILPYILGIPSSDPRGLSGYLSLSNFDLRNNVGELESNPELPD